MSCGKVIELVGCSTESWDDAIHKALEKAAETLRGIRGIEVQNMTAKVNKGKVVEYRANLKLAFDMEE